jgi:putative transposase
VPKYRRLVVPGYPHHITQRGVRRQTTFFDERDYRAYLTLASALLQEHDVEYWAYCLMPNHIHAVVVPHADNALSRFFATLHRRYARRTNARLDWHGHLWQERFYSVVMDEPHALVAMRYVELNPVRAGLVRFAADWPWSSAKGNLGLLDDPLVDRSATRDLVANWDDYLAEPARPNEQDDLRRQTRVGRPSGSAAFIDQIEMRSGRQVRKTHRRDTKKR